MERYHLDYNDGETALDCEGELLPNAAAARAHLTSSLADLIKHHPDTLWSRGTLQLDVVTEAGSVLFTLAVTALDLYSQTGC